MNCKDYIARVLALCLGVILQAHDAAAMPPEQRKDSLQMPEYVRIVGYAATPEAFLMDDSLFYSVSRGVVFPVNKYALPLNDPFLAELKESVLPQARRRDLRLAGIGIRGAASPEGPYRWNVQLSQRRAKALIDFITSELGQAADSLFNTHMVAEDYAFLARCMEDAHDPETFKVKAMLLKHGKNLAALKREMQQTDGGKLWKRLLEVYFPSLRAARVVLYFTDMSTMKAGNVRIELPAVEYVMPPAEAEIPDLGPVTAERQHILSVSTNLLYDGFYMPNYGWAPAPNVELEYYPRSGHWTYLAAFTSPYYHRWAKHKFFQIRDYHLEVRRYFYPTSLHTGFFVSAYANANIYGIGFSKTKGWEGEGAGAAVKAGYVFRLSKAGRWRMEVSAAVGGYVTRYDPYVFGNPVTGTEDGLYYYDYRGLAKDFMKRNYQRTWFGPTELSLRLRYDLLYRRIQKKGVSVKRKEVLWP